MCEEIPLIISTVELQNSSCRRHADTLSKSGGICCRKMCIYGELASEKNYALALSNPNLNVDKYSQKTYCGRFKLYIMLPLLCVCTNVPKVGIRNAKLG